MSNLLDFVNAFSVEIDHCVSSPGDPHDRAGYGACALVDDAPADLQARWNLETEDTFVFPTRETPGAVRWHTRDDDGDATYSGWLVEAADGGAWEMAFAWSARDAGSVSILNGRWEMIIG